MRILFTLMFAVILQLANCQIPNNGFTNWTYLTDSFGFSTYIPTDTFSYLSLDNWTSVNQLTGNPSTGGKFLVNQYMDNGLGKAVARMNTDSIYIAGTLDRGMIAPGFIVNGHFRFDLATIIFTDGGAVNPASLAGAGTGISQRYSSVSARVKYSPIPGDSLLMWAVLKKNGSVIATTKTYYTQSDANYADISGVFSYTSCAVPDTVVLMIASSNPNFSTLLSGTSGLNPGSVLLLDSVWMTPEAGAGYPIVNSYNTYMFENQSAKVFLLSRDTDCSALGLTASITAQPNHGTASLLGTDTLLYTPTHNFTGIDTVFFSVSNGAHSSPGFVRVSIFTASGIADLNISSCTVYPNPSKDIVRIHTGEIVDCNVQIIDVTGRICLQQSARGQDFTLDIKNLVPGTYIVKIEDLSGFKPFKLVKE